MMLELSASRLDQRMDQLIDAIEHSELIKAVDLVRGMTGASERQAVELVLTMAESFADAEATGLFT